MGEAFIAPADWALTEATRRCGCSGLNIQHFKEPTSRWDEEAVIQLARMIETHEERPVDPDLILARKIAADVRGEADESHDGKRPHPTVAGNIRAGKFDDHQLVRACLAMAEAVRGTDIELAKSEPQP